MKSFFLFLDGEGGGGMTGPTLFSTIGYSRLAKLRTFVGV